jgi:hypothetical protein
MAGRDPATLAEARVASGHDGMMRIGRQAA